MKYTSNAHQLTHSETGSRTVIGEIVRDRDVGGYVEHRTRLLHYRFWLHQHPFVTQLTREFIRGAVPRLQAADTELRPALDNDFFATRYKPAKSLEEYPASDPPKTGVVVDRRHPRYDLDFGYGGPYSVYNWELFFHIPLAIAVHLSRNQRFKEARDWLHYIFDPTDTSDEPAPQRYWKFAPFKTTPIEELEKILTNLSTGDDVELKQTTVDAINEWREAPFSPHVVARARPSMYMEKTVQIYLDTLIGHGDFLFQQDATEAIDEAASYYLQAFRMLGERPQPVPRAGTVRPQNYDSIRARLDEFSNVLEDIESDIPYDVVPGPDTGDTVPQQSPEADSLGRSLYFCVPHNEKLLEYWDTIADRLYKIRNSLNIRGIFRELPLFDPPIDPAMLARAAAAGVDVGAVVAGLNQPLPTVKFQFLVQKAISICQEGKQLASQLLSTIEKDDAEALALMRARHEREMLELGEAVRYGQLQEATKQLEALQLSLDGAFQRYVYFERLLGKRENEIALPEFAPLDVQGLLDLKLKAREPVIEPRTIAVDVAENAGAFAEGKLISRPELRELTQSATSRDQQTAAAVVDLIGGILGLIPQFDGNGAPVGVGATVSFGGVQLGQMMRFMSSALRIGADVAAGNASLAGKIAGFARREQEWTFQSNNVAQEIGQIFKQLRSAEIRKALAERELNNHRRQIENAKEVDAFLNDERRGKQSNRGLYAYMKRDLRNLHTQTMTYALEVAGKAQRALQHELGMPELRYLGSNYTGGREGMLAGEKLMADLQRMELEFHENNPPTLKPLVHVALSEVDPLALLQLRATGRCRLIIVEPLLDRTGPGEYFRRIKSVSCSIPCTVGPYVGVHCKLTLRNSTIRKSALLPDPGPSYTREGAEDARFEEFRGVVNSVVVSGAINDSGLVDEGDGGIRGVPFENYGAIGEWDIQLPADPSKGEPTSFDYSTITDVVLSIRYSARDGGERLRRAAMDSLVAMLKEANASGAGRLFSIRHDFPDAWARFKATSATPAAFAPIEITLGERHYPFWARNRIATVTRSMLLAPSAVAGTRVRRTQAVTTQDDTLVHQFGEAPHGVAGATLQNNPLAATTGTARWLLSDNSMSDLWLFVGWQA